jgi:hypothetical protein
MWSPLGIRSDADAVRGCSTMKKRGGRAGSNVGPYEDTNPAPQWFLQPAVLSNYITLPADFQTPG